MVLPRVHSGAFGLRLQVREMDTSSRLLPPDRRGCRSSRPDCGIPVPAHDDSRLRHDDTWSRHRLLLPLASPLARPSPRDGEESRRFVRYDRDKPAAADVLVPARPAPVVRVPRRWPCRRAGIRRLRVSQVRRRSKGLRKGRARFRTRLGSFRRCDSCRFARRTAPPQVRYRPAISLQAVA